MRAALLVALALLAPGCSIFLAPPDETTVTAGMPADAPPEETRLRERMTQHPEDLGPRFALAREQERRGLVEAAALNYGVVAESLPIRRFTRPWLCFARCELALARDGSAERALHEVLACLPDDDSGYVLNPDYREAAVRLAPLLERREKWAELEALHKRYLEQLDGDPEEWPR